MLYRRLPTPLHAASAVAGLLYCLSLAVAALLLDHPLPLCAVSVAALGAGALAGVGRQLRRALLLAVPLAVLITVVNALVSHNGLTVILRLGDLPLLGHTDVTLEAVVFGAVSGLRAVALILCGALYTVAVDPDEVLRLFRRVSFRSALTATLATRMVPVLLRDSRRLADAARCRPGPPPGRVALLRVATAGMLDRALDVAAALEVRGYGGLHRPPRVRRPVSRHDLAFGGAAIAILVLALAARVAGLASLQTYPVLRAGAGAGPGLVAAGVLLAALAPFSDWRGVRR